MKRLLLLLVLVFSLSGCGSPVVNPPAEPPTVTPHIDMHAPPTNTPIPPTAVPTDTPAAPQAQPVFFGPLHFSLPQGLAAGISGTQVPRADSPDLPARELTPGHTQVKLEGYLLQGKSQEPQIYVYPAQAYAEMQNVAFESLRQIDNLLGNPVAPIPADQLPAVPFFNEKQVFASSIQVISFQNGRGVRFLTEYAQYPAPVNNQDLFYLFQGVSSDGYWYVVAILPVTNPNLADTSDAGAPLPPGGVPYPFKANPSADMAAYYSAATALLEGASPTAFSPTLDQLDGLIQSIQIYQ
jgi:hypothetical protein